MIVGFTGTQIGMTMRQRQLFQSFFEDNHVEEFHHGDCIGADCNAHDIVREKFPEIAVVIHPPRDERKRAKCAGAQQVLPAHDYLIRNQHIVNASGILLACPKSEREELRSGTWATIRYARKQGKPVVIIV